MKKGALLHRDHNGNTPAHLAAKNGHRETIKLILNVHSHLLDQTDKDGVRSFVNRLGHWKFFDGCIFLFLILLHSNRIHQYISQLWKINQTQLSFFLR